MSVVNNEASLFTTYKQQMHKIFNTTVSKTLLHVSMPQCNIFREFFCYSKATRQISLKMMFWGVETCRIFLDTVDLNTYCVFVGYMLQIYMQNARYKHFQYEASSFRLLAVR